MATLAAVLSDLRVFAPGAAAGLPALRPAPPTPARARLASGLTGGGTAYAGAYTVSGAVTLNTVPAQRKVRLYRLNTGQLVDETWSGEDGQYQFTGLELGEYFVWSEDHARQYDPVSHLVPLQGG